MTERYSEWKTELRCYSCDGELSWKQKMFSLGRCPLCGFKHPKAATIVRCKEVPYKLKYTAPWWKFWIKPQKIYWDESAARLLELLQDADKSADKQRRQIQKIMEGEPPFDIEPIKSFVWMLAIQTKYHTIDGEISGGIYIQYVSAQSEEEARVEFNRLSENCTQHIMQIKQMPTYPNG